MVLVTQQIPIAPQKRSRKVPDYLIYEVIDGRPLYYKGYKEVLKQRKTSQEIMGASGLQSFIIQYILEILYQQIGRKAYHFLTNEVGSHLGYKSNLSGDIHIFERAKLPADKINTKYIDVPPQVAIEIDVRIDMSEGQDYNYVLDKTEKLLNFGVEKVIWIFTEHKKVMIAVPNQNWITIDWTNDIELLEGHCFNIGRFLDEEGIK